MANSPQSTADQNAAVDFRAPPPSPIASGRRSSVANDDVLTDFLEHSLRVPDLILPDRVFPRQKSIESPPAIDFRSIESPETEDITVATILDSIAQIGCFQLVNHGITREQIRSATAAGAGIFNLPPEKKVRVSTSPEKPYGFEEFQGETDRETSEEFVWSRDEGLKREMEGIWPLGYSNFSEKMERLLLDIEKVAGKVLLALEAHHLRKPLCGNGTMQRQEFAGPICFLYKHCRRSHGSGGNDQWVSSLRYDVIRMLIRGGDYSHALCLHVCDIGSSEFHVYSKRGWVSFYTDPDALVITIGDQIQAWSDGRCKHVIGRPVMKGEEGECVSLAFLYSPPSSRSTYKPKLEKTISLGQQAVVALAFTLLYHLLIYIFKQ
ncbi:Aminocyclopropanecarboxylate oxidase [Bertholletia excelsa]